MRNLGLLRLGLLLLGLPMMALAQESAETLGTKARPTVSQLPQVDGGITVDGSLDEAVWQQALVIPLDIETRPGENTAAPVRTLAYLMQNGEQLLVGFYAYDPDPDAIRAYLRDRDSAYADDFVGIAIDTFDDQRRAFEFFANPLGVQMDLILDDVNGNEDDSWDAIWDSAGEIKADGFVVEMAIPFNQIRFTQSAQAQTWGIDILRFYPRNHRYRLSNNAQDRAVDCYLCQLDKVSGFAGIEPGRDLEIVPTLTASRFGLSEDPGVSPIVDQSTDAELGVNVRWGISQDLTLNLALNPDFSQVEADVAQLAVNEQFALFFPEKRPFFLEGADFFSSPIRAVFTRTIADPNVGVKLTGKQGDNTFGLFAADDEVTNLLFPGTFGSRGTSLDQSSQSFVGRYRRGFGNNSTIGVMFTGRSGDEYSNYVGGIDGRYRVTDNDSIRFQYLASSTEYPTSVVEDFSQPAGSFDGSAMQIQYNHNSRDWFWYLNHQDYDPDFRADLGFVTRVNFEKQVVGLGRVWHGEEEDWWNQLQVNGDWDITHDDNGRLLEREIEAYFSFQGPLQSFFEVGRMERDRLFNDVLFDEQRWSVFGEIKPKGGLSINLFASYGDNIDFANTRLGRQLVLEPGLDWNINKHLLLRWRNATVILDSLEGPNIFKARLDDLRLTWQFNVRSFLRVVLQNQEVERNQAMFAEPVNERVHTLGTQLLYSYKLNPQSVFFLGYSDNHINRDDLTSLTQSDRTIFTKVGYAWFP